MLRSPVIWLVLAVMAVSAAVFVGRSEETRDRVVAVERSACRSEASCKRLLNRLLRYATPRQKKAIVGALPNIRERIRRQIPRKERPAPAPDVPRATPAQPAPGVPPVGPTGPPGPKGDPGPRGEPGRPAPSPPPQVPTTPEPVPLPELPPLPGPVCDLLPALCPE